jgi:hypothetical protein
MAAKIARAAAADYQAFIYEYQDILGLVISLETNDGAGIVSWQDIYREWMKHSPAEVSKGNIGEAYVYTALFDDEDAETSFPGEGLLPHISLRIGEAVFKSLPGSEGNVWRAPAFNFTNAGNYVWEGDPFGERRVLAVAAPLSRKDELFSWAVWTEQTQLSPLGRYLMHTSKVRYTQQVFERDIGDIRKRRQPIDNALKGLLTIHKGISTEKFVQPDTIAAMQVELNRMQDESYKLLDNISRLKEMKLTTQIAENNIKELLPLPASAYDSLVSGHSPFKQDLSRVAWLREQIDIERGYLEAARERAEEGHQVMTLRLELEAQKNARRLSNLVLLQGSLIGALVVMLTAAQAFGAKLPLHENLFWPLIGLLGALALALPPLFTHWHEGLHRADLIAGGLLGAMLAWFGTLFWSIYLYDLSVHVPHGLWMLYEVASLVAGFSLAYLLLRVINHKSRRESAKRKETSQG